MEQKYILIILFSLWVLFELSINIFSKKYNKNKLDRHSLLFIGLIYCISIYFIYKLFWYIPIWDFFFIFLILFTFGFFLRIYSFCKLAKSFNIYITVSENPILIKNGLYSIIRHPGYLGSILIYFSLTSLFYYDIILWILFLIIIILYIIRINEEESHLLNYYKYEYIKYKQKTKFLIPFIL